MSDVKITASGAKIVKALESLRTEGMDVRVETVPDRRDPGAFPERYDIQATWNREILSVTFKAGKFVPVRGDGPETLKEVHAFIAEWSGRWSDVVREGDRGEIGRLGVEGFTAPDEDGPSVADMIMSDPGAVLITLDGAVADVQVQESAPEVTADVQDTPAPAPEAVPVAAPAPVKAKRTRKPKAVPAPVAEESAPAAPVLSPGDVIADIAVRVGGMINKWADVAQGLARMTGAERAAAASGVARDFAECTALQADADGQGTALGALDADANRIMWAARKILRDTHALISGAEQYRGDRLAKTQRRTFRKAVAPWRADATAALPAA